MPPASLKTERAILGALLVANSKERDETTKQLSPSDFHDPWYRYVFATLKRNRGSKQSWSLFKRSDRYELARLLILRDGTPACGRVAALPKMIVALKALRRMREKELLLMRQLSRIMEESAKLVKNGENDL